MSNTYTWIIDSLDCIPSADGKNNIVSNVNWKVGATDGKNNAIIYGAQPLAYTAKSQFISYFDLKQSVVIKWVQDAIGIEQVASIQKNLDNQINILANPPVITPPLPWI
jgi:hypothetical protein